MLRIRITAFALYSDGSTTWDVRTVKRPFPDGDSFCSMIDFRCHAFAHLLPEAHRTGCLAHGVFPFFQFSRQIKSKRIKDFAISRAFGVAQICLGTLRIYGTQIDQTELRKVCITNAHAAAFSCAGSRWCESEPFAIHQCLALRVDRPVPTQCFVPTSVDPRRLVSSVSSFRKNRKAGRSSISSTSPLYATG